MANQLMPFFKSVYCYLWYPFIYKRSQPMIHLHDSMDNQANLPCVFPANRLWYTIYSRITQNNPHFPNPVSHLLHILFHHTKICRPLLLLFHLPLLSHVHRISAKRWSGKIIPFVIIFSVNLKSAHGNLEEGDNHEKK